MRIAAVFPGQGSHRAGALDPWLGHPAADLLEAIDRGVGRDVLALTRDESAGGRTADAQPAIFAVSMVAWRALQDAGVHVDVVAGHSLGEYTAATAAGCLDVVDGAAVVAARGRAMGRACVEHPGAMAAVIRLAPDVVEALVAQVDGLVVANDNAPGQVVVAGPPEAVAAVSALAREAGGRAIILEVEGAFHSSAMASAVEPVAQALEAAATRDPAVPIVSGSTGATVESAEGVVAALVDGILSPVRWRDVQDTLGAHGITDLVEVGPGGVLAGMARRALPDVTVHSVQTPDDLDTVAAALAGAVSSDSTEETQ
ncbi:MAG: ACP S-malonyltransferase [Nitriliruptoraceae bacterium]